MPRKGPPAKREIQPDPIYQNALVTQLINKVLLNGKKTVAERTVYKALEIISERTANDPVITLKRALDNVKPTLEVRSRRVGGLLPFHHQHRVAIPVELLHLGDGPAARDGCIGLVHQSEDRLDRGAGVARVVHGGDRDLQRIDAGGRDPVRGGVERARRFLAAAPRREIAEAFPRAEERLGVIRRRSKGQGVAAACFDIDQDESRPFRETNYNPELFWRLLRPAPSWGLWGGNLGLEHESNGAREPDSRSWNRVYLAPFVEYGRLRAELKLWRRLSEEAKKSPDDTSGDENPDISDFYGYGELRLAYLARWQHRAALMARWNFATGKGAVQLDYSVPTGTKNLFIYGQLWSGYGESLIDYNRSLTRYGIGVLIRHYFNTKHATGRHEHWTWAASAILFIGIMWLSSGPKIGGTIARPLERVGGKTRRQAYRRAGAAGMAARPRSRTFASDASGRYAACLQLLRVGRRP